MEVRIGDSYVSKHPNGEDAVVTKLYKKLIAPGEVQSPEGRIWPELAERLKKRNETETSGIWVTAEQLHGAAAEFCIPLESFEQGFGPDGARPTIDRPESIELINGIFNTFIKGVYSSGGDGYGTLLSKYYDFRLLADMFGEYELPMHRNPNNREEITDHVKMKDMYHRCDYDDHVLFSDMSNENFTIGPAFPSSKAPVFSDIFIVF